MALPLNEARDVIELYRLVREELRRYHAFIGDSDELGHQAFLKIWESLGIAKMSTALFPRTISRTYVRRALRSVVIDRHRRDFRLSELPPDNEDADEPLPDERVAAVETLRKIWASLDADERVLLHLLYVEGASPDEVAKTLGISEGALRVRLSRVRRRIRVDSS